MASVVVGRGNCSTHSLGGWRVRHCAALRCIRAATEVEAPGLLRLVGCEIPNASREQLGQVWDHQRIDNRRPTRRQLGDRSVKSCADLHARSRELKGATSGDLSGIRVGDLAANRQMFEEIPKLNIGGTAGPFRVAEGPELRAAVREVADRFAAAVA